jgi:hypoxia up-regulated 1
VSIGFQNQNRRSRRKQQRRKNLLARRKPPIRNLHPTRVNTPKRLRNLRLKKRISLHQPTLVIQNLNLMTSCENQTESIGTGRDDALRMYYKKAV